MSVRKASTAAAEREAFIKGQIISVHKALNKTEVPLKQKHVRSIIVGTHKERSCSIFWNTISRIQLEKNPILTWKFCHIVHKLIRDGHRKVIEESLRCVQRITQLGNFWQHLQSSSYGLCNSSYCKMLISRLEFHKRNPAIPGNLILTDSQVNTMINTDVNQSFELSVEMLDQMDDLLAVQINGYFLLDLMILIKCRGTVFDAMGVVKCSAQTPQGQCLIAPLILVIMDTSKFYDYMVKTIFKLHSQLPPDALSGHRERFSEIFNKVKKFYMLASAFQYFKFLVSIPTLPAQSPNFLQASDFDVYQSPQAVLHGDNVSECETPPDAVSVDENLVDISDMSFNDHEMHQEDHGDEMIEVLKRDVENLTQANDRLINEARSRFDQYEGQLMQVKQENEQCKLSLDQSREEVEQLRRTVSHLESNRIDQERFQDLERKAQTGEQNFQKMKNAYSLLREEHIQALTKLSTLQKDAESVRAEQSNKEEAYNSLSKKLDELTAEKSVIEEKARGASSDLSDVQHQLSSYQVKEEALNKAMEKLKCERETERSTMAAEIEQLKRELSFSMNDKSVVEERACRAENDFELTKKDLCNATDEAKRLNEELESMKLKTKHDIEELIKSNLSEKNSLEDQMFASACTACKNVIVQSREELHNAPSITYPLQLVLPTLRSLIESVENLDGELNNRPCCSLLSSLIVFGHSLSNIVVNSAAAAYTRSIQHFEPVGEQCRLTITTALDLFDRLQAVELNGAKTNLSQLKSCLEHLEQLCLNLPATSDVDMDVVGAELEEEMHRMAATIKKAVEMIAEMQKTSRAKDSGIRLEVNENILDSCNALMGAIVMLVEKSRAMQEEIVSLGRGTASPSEFYKRNHQWTEGLLSAAKAVGVAAMVLVQSADGVITGQGKLEHLIVASQEIAASTAQLFVSSRVKADRESKGLSELSSASKSVNKCTANVVATVKAAQTTLNDIQNLDFSNLSLHEAKKEEMESQVRTLELEAKLTQERARLSELRKRHYHLASLVSNENANTNSKEEASNGF